MDDHLIRRPDVSVEMLSDNGEFKLSRARLSALGVSWLTVEGASLTLAGVRHALDIGALLDNPIAKSEACGCFAVPREFFEREEGLTLVLDDRDGFPLRAEMPYAKNLKRFLTLAANLAGAIAFSHERYILLGDMRPETLIGNASGTVALTAFMHAIASQNGVWGTQSGDLAEGLYPYMAPEQTGRMNRPIDARTDLYSLGVTLYELLSGKLPFHANSLLEWIHCHVAKQPAPLSESVAELPSTIETIVLTLLAKAPEERYQSARAVQRDLLQCLARWTRSGKIEPFELALRPPTNLLWQPGHLIGRDPELDVLSSALERVSGTDSMEIVMVAGYSGVGKSSVVDALRETAVASQARFASGKFDQYKRNSPYAAIVDALKSVIQQNLGQGDEEVARWRQLIMTEVGMNGQLMIDFLPELELVIGAQTPVTPLGGQDERVRFQNTLSRFLGTFGQRGRPLVLFLDDLQWVDTATLALLLHVGTGSPVNHLLLIGAYRDNDVDAAHPMTATLDAIRKSGGEIQTLSLAPLTLPDVGRLIGSALHTTSEPIDSLAKLVFEKTGGNPFFVMQFVQTLVDEDQVVFDSPSGAWNWRLEQIKTQKFSENIVDLMLGKLENLSGETQLAMSDLACLGIEAPIALLADIGNTSIGLLQAAFAGAVSAGLVTHRQGSYAFLHDRVQEAAYALIPQRTRATTHLRIGRKLASDPNALEGGRQIFDVVNQFEYATSLIDDPVERQQIAHVYLLAGQRARTATAFSAALGYFATGNRLGGGNLWDADPVLAFSLEYNLAECEFLTGATAEAEARLQLLALRRPAQLADRAAVAWLRITLYTAKGQIDAAVAICLDYLREVGTDWTPHPSRELARKEYDTLIASLGGASIGSLINLPQLTDPDRTATLDVLTAVLPPAFFSDQNLVCLVLCRMANLGISFGNSDATSLGYAYLGMVTGPCFDDYDIGYEFGLLGLKLVDDRKLNRFAARVYLTFSYHVTPWTKHVRTELSLLQRAYDAALESGDLTYVGFTSCSMVTSLLAAGEPLRSVEDLATERLYVVEAAKFGLVADIITSQLRLIRALRGEPNGDAWSDASFEAHLGSHSGLAIAACWYWIRKLEADHIFGKIDGAMNSLRMAEPLLWTSSGHLEMAEFHFFAALATARAWDTASSTDQGDLQRKVEEHYAQILVWARHCAANFDSRAALVCGELRRIQGADFAAMQSFEAAIELAKDSDLVNVEALAHETAARFYASGNFPGIALLYLSNAHRAYGAWGATGKLRALEEEHVGLARLHYDDVEKGNDVLSNLDVESLVRTSEAIAGELNLEKLIRTLMSVLLQHAGAKRALLILPNADDLWIEAEALVDNKALQVTVQRRRVSARELPMSVLHYAIRTGELIHIDDATVREHPFSSDSFISGRRPRSVLCLPLIKQRKLIGVMYLENDLSPGVFTPARVTVLKLLASQAAVSLENASLEEKTALLEEKEALLKEVHHRVKNNLQLISSLLNLQASRAQDTKVAELFTESRNRVRSMALVHENLYRAGNFARIPMAGHVERLCGQLVRAYDMHRQNVTLEIDVDGLELGMNSAVSCGLIINELVSNALKHAFPGGQKGRVHVSLITLSDERCRLRVSDNGTGMPADFEIGRAGTLGLQLIDDLTRQLKGDMEVSSIGGATFTITFHSSGRNITQP